MLMDGEKVVLKVQVSSRFYDSKIDILTASLPEAAVSEEEVMIIGRLCHPQPSANDNAGGSGGSDKEGSYDR